MCQARSPSMERSAEEAARTPAPDLAFPGSGQSQPRTSVRLSPARHRLALCPHLWEGRGGGWRPPSTLAPSWHPARLQTESLFCRGRPVSPIVVGAASTHRPLARAWMLRQGPSAWCWRDVAVHLGRLGPAAPGLVRHWGWRQPAGARRGARLLAEHREEAGAARSCAGRTQGWGGGAGCMSQCLTQSRNHGHLTPPALGLLLPSAGVSLLQMDSTPFP